MNIKDLFDAEVAVTFEIDKHLLTFYFRQPTADEELEFRRRTSRQRIRENGTLEATDAALKAPMFLYSKCLKRVTLQNGDGNVEEVSKEDQVAITDQLKLDAWAVARTRIKKKEQDEIQD